MYYVATDKSNVKYIIVDSDVYKMTDYLHIRSNLANMHSMSEVYVPTYLRYVGTYMDIELCLR